MIEETTTTHQERIIYNFKLKGKSIDMVMTKHGHYRILEQKGISFKQFGKNILAIGKKEMEEHFENAMKIFPLHERKHEDWKTKINYTLSVYDVTNKMVIMFGIHPHLKRITIITIIPRIKHVASNQVYGVYRIDTEKTKNQMIYEKLPFETKMKNIVLTQQKGDR